MIFPPVSLKADVVGHRPICSVQVSLPAETDTEIRRYVKEDDMTSWTVIIHEALYVYRRQFWTREQEREELNSEIEKGLRSLKEGKGTLVTPAFWKEFEVQAETRSKEIDELIEEGKIGNLLRPKELYDFVKERISSRDSETPTDVICAAMPFLRAERARLS